MTEIAQLIALYENKVSSSSTSCLKQTQTNFVGVKISIFKKPSFLFSVSYRCTYLHIYSIYVNHTSIFRALIIIFGLKIVIHSYEA